MEYTIDSIGVQRKIRGVIVAAELFQVVVDFIASSGIYCSMDPNRKRWNLQQKDLKRKVEPSRIKRIWDERAMLEGGRGVVNYWSKRDIPGLLLMPPTRHCFLHLNEARRLLDKIR